MFQFLVLLSYECFQPKFNQAKAIMGMPKIIQLCDGIMAGGQPAKSHGNDAIYYFPNVLCSSFRFSGMLVLAELYFVVLRYTLL